MFVVSAHVVVDGGVVLVGDLGVVEPPDVVEEGEELSVGDRIEREQTLFLCRFCLACTCMEAQPPQQLELGTQLYRA